MTFRWLYALAFALLICGNLPARAVQFYGNENVAPYAFKNADGEPLGLAYQLAVAALRASGVQARVNLGDWAETQQQMRDGQIDGLIHINPTPDRTRYLLFSDPLVSSEFVIFKRADDLGIQRLSDLHGRRVGVEPKGLPYTLVKSSDQIRLVEVRDWPDAFSSLARGDLDAVVVDRWVGEYHLSEAGQTGVIPLHPPLDISHSRIAVGTEQTELLAQINRGLDLIQQNGSRERIENQWRDQRVYYYSREDVQQLITNSVATLLIVGLVALVACVAQRRKNQATLQKAIEEHEHSAAQYRGLTRGSTRDIQELIRQALIHLQLVEFELSDTMPAAPKRHLGLAIDAAQSLRDQAHRMARFADLESEPCPKELVSMQDLTTSVVDQLGQGVSGQPIQVNIGALPTWQASANHMQELIACVLEFFTADKEASHQIRIESSKAHELVVISDLMTMASDEAEQAFDLVQTSGAVRALDLPLAQRIIDRYGGSISFTSSDDPGTRLTIKMPMERVAAT